MLSSTGAPRSLQRLVLASVRARRRSDERHGIGAKSDRAADGCLSVNLRKR